MKPINLDTQSSSDVRYLNLSNIPKSYEDVVNTVLEERQSLSVVEVDKVKGYVVNIENENQDVCDLTLTAHEVGKFATEFRTKRIWLGISIETFHSSFDSWVGEEVKFNIRDFETLDLTMEESIYLLPDLKEWLEQVEKAKAEGDVALAKFLGKDLKAKQRKCLNEKTKAKLMKLYEDTPNPTKKQMQELSKEIMIAEFSIEQWFHKKRRFDKRENRIKARLEAKKKNEERLNKEKNAYWDEKLKNLMSDYYKEKEFNKKLFERLKSEGKRTSKGRKRKLKQTTKETEKKNLMEDKVASATSEDVPPQRNLRERKNRKKYIEDESFNNDEVSVSEMQENIQQQQNDLFSHMSNSQTIEKEENDNKDNPTPHNYSDPLPPVNSIFSRQVTSTIPTSTVTKHISDQNNTTQVCSSQTPVETSPNQIMYPRNISTLCSNMKTTPVRCVIKIPSNTNLKAQQQNLINGQVSGKAKDKEFHKQTLSDMPITLTDTESKFFNSSIPICELVPQISDSTKSNTANTPHISDIGNEIPQQLLKPTPSKVAQDNFKVAGPPKLNCSKTNVLLMVFSQTHHPDISMIQFLSAQLKLSTSSVEKWFEMMRLQNNIS
uniref:Transcription factor protein n=1 Tax=Ciona intestinalis TaxID=7719 RepID=Q4H2X7_CIOIN|nr:transcription factor protein [Ciona intestinalis]BAE06650.1 transcription factor protein [Ciona intestinalis]|eukprot:NP_001071960.1 transcription factor protein [Ciona intestinalis]